MRYLENYELEVPFQTPIENSWGGPYLGEGWYEVPKCVSTKILISPGGGSNRFVNWLFLTTKPLSI